MCTALQTRLLALINGKVNDDSIYKASAIDDWRRQQCASMCVIVYVCCVSICPCNTQLQMIGSSSLIQLVFRWSLRAACCLDSTLWTLSSLDMQTFVAMQADNLARNSVLTDSKCAIQRTIWSLGSGHLNQCSCKSTASQWLRKQGKWRDQ